MTCFLLSANIILIIAAAILLSHIVRYRRRFHPNKYEKKRPIPEVPLSLFDKIFIPNEFCHTIDTEVSLFLNGDCSVVGGTSDIEAWIIANLAKQSRCIFEFGTATGKTTYLLARNSPKNAQIITLTLHPAKKSNYFHESGDFAIASNIAVDETIYTKHFYIGTQVEHKITQLYVDSKQFDETLYIEQCDLIFIDGSHAYSYVKSDTEKALRMLKPGGIILWHDCRGPKSESKDVYRYLNELSKTLKLFHLNKTSIVSYRKTGI